MTSDVRILVIDDNQTMRNSVIRILGSENYTTQEAVDGQEGLEKALGNPPDLILLDLEMPKLNGLEVINALRDREVNIPIILMTSHGSEAVAVELFRKGVKNYLIKPFDPEELTNAIDQALTEVRLRRERDTLTKNLIAANQELRARVHELDTLYQVGKSVTSVLSRAQLLERILDAVFYLTKAEEATILLTDEETGRLHTELHTQRVEGEIGRASRRSAKELVRRASATGESIGAEAMYATPLKIGDKIIGVLLAGNRISGSPFSEHKRQLLLALTDYAAIALENTHLYENIHEANQAKSEFVSLVAHELKQPMTVIRAYADMLVKGRAGPISSQQEEFLDSIRGSTDRMQTLIFDLQDISRMETGLMSLEIVPTRLKNMLEIASREMQAQFKAKSQSIEVRVPEDLPLVQADTSRLMQIITNLFSNAHKYTQEGGRIRARAWQQGDYVRCAVLDNGVGMSEEEVGQLFTKFFRAEAPGPAAATPLRINPASRRPGIFLRASIAKKAKPSERGSIVHRAAHTCHKPVREQNKNSNPLALITKAGMSSQITRMKKAASKNPTPRARTSSGHSQAHAPQALNKVQKSKIPPVVKMGIPGIKRPANPGFSLKMRGGTTKSSPAPITASGHKRHGPHMSLSNPRSGTPILSAMANAPIRISAIPSIVENRLFIIFLLSQVFLRDGRIPTTPYSYLSVC
ncbi:MAG: Sensor histidine kinase TmoS [Chloroflexi bacterium]|nr:Sensor histidine kinase TmoS [Chloroflexota bacterium]